MIYIAICEEEEKERKYLAYRLKKELECRQIAARILPFANGTELLNAAEDIEFEIYFIDITMDQLNGVEVTRRIRMRNENAAIIITTSSRNHYAEAFEVGAVHYLVRPHTEEEIQEALGRALRRIVGVPRYIELTMNREKKRIFLEDILWAESRDKVVEIHMSSGEGHCYMKLDEFENLLQDGRFLRCHRSFIINMDKVCDMGGASFYMTDGMIVPVRQSERTQMRQRYKDYLFEKKLKEK